MDTEHSEDSRNVQQDSERFRNLPNNSEAFRNVPNLSERNENHILTAREVTRMFEDAGVSRTERSIINWCHPEKYGTSRLDCFYDANERKYFITPQSVERAIKEEQAKIKAETVPQPSETTQHIPNGGTSDEQRREREGHETTEHIKKARELEQEIMDLKITNKGKDYFIAQLKEDREQFVRERQTFVQQLMTQNHRIGELETKLLQLEAPRPGAIRDVTTPVENHDAEIVEPQEISRATLTHESVSGFTGASEKPSAEYL